MNIKQETIQKIKDFGYTIWGDFGCNGWIENDQDFETATHIVITSLYAYKVNRFKAPKSKEITFDWIMNKLSQESSYKNLCTYLSKVFNYSINIYPTSYGVGVDTFLGKHKESSEKVAEKLSELGLKYRNEFSDAHWVYRFIISKCEDNMKILKSL